jgi:uncharacterized protein
MSQYVYLLKPVRSGMLTEGPTESEAAVARRHAEHLRQLAREGRVLLFGRTQENDERTFGLVLLEAEDEDDARRVMESDPAVAEALMTATLHPYEAAGGSLLR